jgi:hypothetical protein
MARRKSKELKENEDDLLFYLEYWQEFPDTFKRVAEKEIAELENKIKTKEMRKPLRGHSFL